MNKAWRASRSIASIFSARKKKKPKFDPFKSEIPSIVESCVTFIEQYGLYKFTNFSCVIGLIILLYLFSFTC